MSRSPHVLISHHDSVDREASVVEGTLSCHDWAVITAIVSVAGTLSTPHRFVCMSLRDLHTYPTV